jgi:hypothetical protein
MSIVGLNVYHGDFAAVSVRRCQIGCQTGRGAILANQTLGGITNSGDRLLSARGRANGKCDQAYRCQSQFVIAGKGSPAMKARSRQKLVGSQFVAPCYRPGFLSGVDKAAAGTELVARHSYVARVGASYSRQKAVMFFSICVSEPDYAYILRRFW